MFYISIGCILVIFTLLEANRKYKSLARKVCYLALLLMIVLAGARHEVGTDWFAYWTFYTDTEETSRVEIGYSLFNNFFSNIGVHYNLFLFTSAAISISLILLFFKQAGAFSAAAVLVFYSDLFLYLNLSGMRQALAISITCFALRYAQNQNQLRFFSLVALASTFHMSALVFFVAYFIPRNLLKWRQLVWIIIAMVVVFKTMESIAQFITLNTLKNASYYLDGIEVSDNLISNYIVGSIKRLSILAIIVLSWKDLKDKLQFQYFLNLYIVGLLVYLFFYTLSADIGVRMSAYFTIIDTILVGLMIIHSRSYLTRFFIAIFISITSFYKILGYSNNPFYDYRFFF